MCASHARGLLDEQSSRQSGRVLDRQRSHRLDRQLVRDTQRQQQLHKRKIEFNRGGGEGHNDE